MWKSSAPDRHSVLLRTWSPSFTSLAEHTGVVTMVLQLMDDVTGCIAAPTVSSSIVKLASYKVSSLLQADDYKLLTP